MTEYNLEDKIKLLKQIKPDNEWKKSTRAFLLSECQSADLEQNTEQARNRFWIPMRLFRFRPAMAAALVIIFTITGCAYGLNISKRSLPGDMFWNVKVSLEKAQVTFSSLEGKVKLETEFAGKRLEELKIVSSEEKPEAVAQAVENFKIYINEAKEGLENLEKEGPGKVKQETYAAMTTAITTTEVEYELWRQDLIGEIEAKIIETQEKLGEIEDEDKLEVLNILIKEAEALLEEGKLGDDGKLVEALEKILEVERMID